MSWWISILQSSLRAGQHASSCWIVSVVAWWTNLKAGVVDLVCIISWRRRAWSHTSKRRQFGVVSCWALRDTTAIHWIEKLDSRNRIASSHTGQRSSICVVASWTLLHTTLTDRISISRVINSRLLWTAHHTTFGVVISIHDGVFWALSDALSGISIRPSYIGLRIPRANSHASSTDCVSPSGSTPCCAYFVGEVGKHVGTSWTILRIDASICRRIADSIRIAVCCGHTLHCLVVCVESNRTYWHAEVDWWVTKKRISALWSASPFYAISKCSRSA